MLSFEVLKASRPIREKDRGLGPLVARWDELLKKHRLPLIAAGAAAVVLAVVLLLPKGMSIAPGVTDAPDEPPGQAQGPEAATEASDAGAGSAAAGEAYTGGMDDRDEAALRCEWGGDRQAHFADRP